MVDQLASEYAAAGQPVVFLEQNVDHPLGERIDRWWAAYSSGGSVSLPLVMVDSGHQFSNGYLGSSAHDTYKDMVDTALARPSQADIQALGRRIGNKIHFDVQLTNLSGVSLSSSNGATVHGLVYEEHTPVDPTVDHVTQRIVRAAVFTGVAPALANGATITFTLETPDLTNVVDWAKLHFIVLADYRPGGSSGAYDMLQAASADVRPALTVNQQASPDPVQSGATLTYTLRVTNIGNVALHAAITDTLPTHVTPTGILTWSPTITAPGGIWEHTMVVTVEAGYSGPLVNTVQVTTEESATGFSAIVTNGYKVYLPSVIRTP